MTSPFTGAAAIVTNCRLCPDVVTVKCTVSVKNSIAPTSGEVLRGQDVSLIGAVFAEVEPAAICTFAVALTPPPKYAQVVVHLIRSLEPRTTPITFDVTL